MPYNAKNKVLRCKNLPIMSWQRVGGFFVGWFVWFGVVVLSFWGFFLRVGSVLKELLKITVSIAAQHNKLSPRTRRNKYSKTL